ncbi:MAG: YceI family protein [Rubripirellula sp.]
MNSRWLCALACGLFLSTDGLQADELTLQEEGSSIEFVGSKSDGSHKGGFKSFDVAAIADFEDPTRSSMNVQIDATSLFSDDDKLTNHLKGPDFFNVRKFPSIIFESREIAPDTESESPKAIIKGDLQMLGETVAVEIPITATVTEESVEVVAEFEIDRTKWGMDYGQGKINNTVKIKAKFQLAR